MKAHIKLKAIKNDAEKIVFAPVDMDSGRSMKAQVQDWCLDHGFELRRVIPLETHLKLHNS